MFRLSLVLSLSIALVTTSFSFAADTSMNDATESTGTPVLPSENAVSQHPVPNDAHFDKQYCFAEMQVLEAWAITKGTSECLVGVVDHGFDLHHPDLRANLLPGYVAEGMEHPLEYVHLLHGTAVAGLIAAQADNGIGIAGLAPKCKVVPAALGTHRWIRERTPESSRKWNELIGKEDGKAIRYLVDRGCRVINLSVGLGTVPISDLEYALQADVVLVAASGNSNREDDWYDWAGVLDVLLVGGLDRKGQRWEADPVEFRGRTVQQGSSYGEGLNVMAPMLDLVLCAPDIEEANTHLNKDRWTQMNFGMAMPGYLWEQGRGGTSWAAPMATALVALIRSLRPDLNHKQVIRIVEQGANDLGEEGWDKYTGWGRLNFHKSLKLAESWPTQK